MVTRLRVFMFIVTPLIVVVCLLAFEKGDNHLMKPIDSAVRIGAHALILPDDSKALPVPKDHNYSFRNGDVTWVPADIEFTWPFRLLQLGKPKTEVSSEQPCPL